MLKQSDTVNDSIELNLWHRKLYECLLINRTILCDIGLYMNTAQMIKVPFLLIFTSL